MKFGALFTLLLYFTLTKMLTKGGKDNQVLIAGIERNTMDETMGIGEFIHVCGGTLLTTSVVLTGCSCISERQFHSNSSEDIPYERVELLEPDQIRVYIGSTGNDEAPNSKKQSVDALALSVHPLCEAKAYAYNYGMVKTMNAFRLDKPLELVLDIDNYEQLMEQWKVNGKCWTESWLPAEAGEGDIANPTLMNDLIPVENITYEWNEEFTNTTDESFSGDGEGQYNKTEETPGEQKAEKTEDTTDNGTNAVGSENPSKLVDNDGIDDEDIKMARESSSNRQNWKWNSYSNLQKSGRMKRQDGAPTEQSNNGTISPNIALGSSNESSNANKSSGEDGSMESGPDILKPDSKNSELEDLEPVVEEASSKKVSHMTIKFLSWSECADIVCQGNSTTCDSDFHDTKLCVNAVKNERLCLADTGSPVYCENTIVGIMSAVNLACKETTTKGVALGIDGAFEYIKSTLGMPEFQKEVPHVARRVGSYSPDFIRVNTFLITSSIVVSFVKNM